MLQVRLKDLQGSIHAPGLLEGMRAPNASELSILLKLLVAYAQGCRPDEKVLHRIIGLAWTRYILYY